MTRGRSRHPEKMKGYTKTEPCMNRGSKQTKVKASIDSKDMIFLPNKSARTGISRAPTAKPM